MASVIQTKITISLKPKQEEFYNKICVGRDMIVNLPVGYGKSILYYYLPEFFRITKKVENPKVIVVSPLTIIQKDQLVKMNQLGIKAVKMDQTGKLESKDGVVSLTAMKGDLYSILLCHPEGLLVSETRKSLLQETAFQSSVVAVVIDECHIVEKWGDTFRTAFNKLRTLPAFFPDAPLIAMSGTLTTEQMKTLPSALGLRNPIVVQQTPDRPNVHLRKIKKETDSDILNVFEGIFMVECDSLKKDPVSYPITLMFMPLKYISHASAYLKYLFGGIFLSVPYSIIYSNQEKDIIDNTIKCLQEINPPIRLILTTSVSGMGFDPPCIERIIHVCPPRNISQYLQEIGRAGRRGQAAEAILYYSNADISLALPDINHDIREYCHSESCLRKALLTPFGFVPNSVTGCSCCSFCKKACRCDICSFSVPDVLDDLIEEMDDNTFYEETETSTVPMEHF